MKRIICVIFGFLCILNAYGVYDEAVSVMHQIYAGQWGLAAVLFFCTAFIVDALKTKINKKSENKLGEK